jgi:hypothetical protein
MAESGAVNSTALTGLRVGAVAAGRLGGAGGDPVAARLDGQRALQPPPSARNPASGELFHALSWACAGGVFALKTGSWTTVFRGVGVFVYAHHFTWCAAHDEQQDDPLCRYGNYPP